MRPYPSHGAGEFARLVMRKGDEHEQECLADYEAQFDGIGSVYKVPKRPQNESFTDFTERFAHVIDEQHDVIFQMPFVHEGVQGIADFLIRVETDDGYGYEPVDAKLARAEAKPAHLLQLCFYAEAIEAQTGHRPENVHVWLGSGEIEPFRTKNFDAYWRHLRTDLAALVAGPIPTDTAAMPCSHCGFCEFAGECSTEWRDADALHYVAGIRSAEIKALESGGVTTLTGLATGSRPVEHVDPFRMELLSKQASLQVEAAAAPDSVPPFEMLEISGNGDWGRGFEHLPEPNDGDIFLDFEGHPFWTSKQGLLFLLGLIECEDGEWCFRAFWAHDEHEEGLAAKALIDYLTERRRKYPDMHAYHYNHTERSALEPLVAAHGVGESELKELVDTGLFVDLYRISLTSLQAGTESYGLKHLERLTGFERSDDMGAGSDAIVEYEKWMASEGKDQSCLDRIAAYNEDDVRATQALRDWLIDNRAESFEWRSSHIEVEETDVEIEERIAKLQAFGPDTSQWLLADLLGYWYRERMAWLVPLRAALEGDPAKHLDNRSVIGGVRYLRTEERFGTTGKLLDGEAMVFGFAEQDLVDKIEKILFVDPNGDIKYADVHNYNDAEREIAVTWPDEYREAGLLPSALAVDDSFRAKPKPQALAEYADSVIASGAQGPNDAGFQLLSAKSPRFTSDRFPLGGLFDPDVDAMNRWITELDKTVVAVQGPPGTGKTFRGAHLALTLAKAGKRVGITAMSHEAIHNFVGELIKVAEATNDVDALRIVQKPNSRKPHDGVVKYTTSNPVCARDDYNVVAGTTYLFANSDMASNPVDVLFIDEAGQLALADAMAALGSAESAVLLGDPQQLPQVSKASHPGDSGHSVLGHVLQLESTIDLKRGVFLSDTRRMHPDVCRFISEQIYEGRLYHHPSCEQQTTGFGTGLRLLKTSHGGCSTKSLEEAKVVVEKASELIGTNWTDQHGAVRPLEAEDIMVVAPYNDQVLQLRNFLDLEPTTRNVKVGTVDKFQGQEAAVVIYTMTSSSADDMPRGPEFLFSRNRLNVAISRARCLAYLVCNDQLLNTRAKKVEHMKLISTLCSFAEYAAANDDV